MQSPSSKMLSWMKAQVGINTAERNINNLRHHSNGRKQRGMKETLDEGEKGGWKAGLKLNIQKTKITASGSITSWQIDGESMATVTDFIFLVSKITADGDCSHEIEMLTLWKKSCDQPRQHIKKQRQYTLPRKVCLIKALVFPVVMYGCEIWTVKVAEC